MSSFPSAPARIAFLAAVITTSLMGSILSELRHETPFTKTTVGLSRSYFQPPPAQASTAPAEREGDQIDVNYRGPVSLIRDDGEDHPAPEVFPRVPLDIVTDDCSRLELFNTDDEAWDSDSGIISMSWWDRGVNESRSLTILTRSPSCKRHPSLRRHVAIIEQMQDQDGP